MALSIEKSQDMLSRLETLEKHDRESKDEMNTLQRDFFSQQREILALEKKNRFLEDKVATLETESRRSKDLIPGLEDKLSKMETRTGFLARKLDSLTTDCNKVYTLETESSRWKDLISGLEDKLSKMETSTGLLARKLDSLTTDCNRKIKNTEDQLTQLRLVFNRALVKGQDDLKQQVLLVLFVRLLSWLFTATSDESQITDLLRRIQQIEDTESQKRQSVTSVLVRPTGGKLTTEQWVKMDDVEEVDMNGGDFDTMTGCVVPQTGGRMVVNVGFRQKGEGEIRISVFSDNGIGRYMGQTRRHNDRFNFTRVLDIQKGQKVWLEAQRVSGDAEFDGCRLDSWLLL